MKHFVFFLTFTCFSLALVAQHKQEMRAVWLTSNYNLDWPDKPAKEISDIYRQEKELDDILDQLQKIHINTIFLQARIRGDVIYYSAMEPYSPFVRSKSLGNKGADLLHYAIEACQKRGIECHAWFVVYPLGEKNASKKVSGKKHLLRSHKGEFYLDPGEPETETYLLRLVRELVSEYDIDGLHFDYIRYPEKAANFPDQATYKRYGKGENKANWRRKNINRFVYKAYDLVKELKPWVQVSSSVIGMHQKIPGNTSAHWSAYHDVYQDAADWLEKGKHDFIVPMMYYTDNLFFPFVSDWYSKSYGRFVVSGLGLYRMDKKEGNWTSDVISEQIRFSRENGMKGNAFYRAKHLLNNKKEILDEIAAHFYTRPALLPPLTWLSDTIPDAPDRVEVVCDGNTIRLSWPKQKENTFYNIYLSKTFPIDTNDPENLLLARTCENQCEILVDDRITTGYYCVVTSYDRFHQESLPSFQAYFVTGVLEK